MGTPGYAADALSILLESGHDILCVVTQPDRPRGRGQKIAFSPVKETALKKSLSLEQPEKVKGNKPFISLLESLKPEIIVVVAYGKILPKEILKIPKYGCINVHASLLPRYRGAAPVQWAFLNGEEETGVTIMRLDELLDTGDIILQRKIKIKDEDNNEVLTKRLFAEGNKLLLEVLDLIKKGDAKYIKQKDAEASYAPAITKESGEIDWRKSAVEIHNRVRAMIPWPVAHTFFRDKLLKIWKTEIHIADLATKHKDPGSIVEVVKNIGFIVATGKGHVLVREVQLEGKKIMSAYNFIIGHDVKIGEILPS